MPMHTACVVRSRESLEAKLLDARRGLSPYCPNMIAPAQMRALALALVLLHDRSGRWAFHDRFLIRHEHQTHLRTASGDGSFSLDTSSCMKPPFDIAGDLDTPVSAYAKLAAFQPRFLLESVEGGERLAAIPSSASARRSKCGSTSRASRSGASGIRCRAAPTSCSDGLRGALARAPRPLPELATVPLAGGLVGYTSYDVVRYFERLPERAAPLPHAPPLLHYVAPPSLLVFDHLTRAHRAAARGHRGRARGAASRSHRRAARAAAGARAARAAATASRSRRCGRDDYIAGVRRAQEYIAAGDVYQLVLSTRFAGRHDLDPFQAYRALRLDESFAVHVLLRTRRADRRRLLARGAGASSTGTQRRCGRSPARGRARARRRRRRARGRAAGRSQGKRRARHAGRPGAQRPRARGRGRQRARRAVSRDRALQPRDAHRQRRARTSWRRAAMPSTCSRRRFRPARWSARPRCARWRSSRSSSRCAAACTAAPSAISARAAPWTRRSRSARSCSTAMNTATRPVPASSPTASPRVSTRKCWQRAPLRCRHCELAGEGL